MATGISCPPSGPDRGPAVEECLTCSQQWTFGVARLRQNQLAVWLAVIVAPLTNLSALFTTLFVSNGADLSR